MSRPAAGRVEALAWFVIQTRSVVGLIFHAVWESLGGGALLAVGKTLAFPQKAAAKAERNPGTQQWYNCSTGRVCEVSDGLWRTQNRVSNTARPARATMATEEPQLFRAVPGAARPPSAWRRARGGPRTGRLQRSARARTPIERERARREPGRSLLRCVKVPRHRRDVVPVMRLLDGVNARTHVDRRRGPYT